jgi:hypothetical protein
VTDVSDLRLVVRDRGFRSTEGSQGDCQGTSYLANRIFQEPELAKSARVLSSFSLPTLVTKTSKALLRLHD